MNNFSESPPSAPRKSRPPGTPERKDGDLLGTGFHHTSGLVPLFDQSRQGTDLLMASLVLSAVGIAHVVSGRALSWGSPRRDISADASSGLCGRKHSPGPNRGPLGAFPCQIPLLELWPWVTPWFLGLGDLRGFYFWLRPLGTRPLGFFGPGLKNTQEIWAWENGPRGGPFF